MSVVKGKANKFVITDHGALNGLGDDDHPQYRDGSLAYTGNLDMGGNDVVNVGLVDGRDVSVDGSVQDAHIADGTIHFTEASIDHLNIQNVGTNTHAQIDSHIADGSIHFTEASIDHVNIQNVGTNTHAQIDAHIADGTIHYADAPADGNTYGRNNNAWVQVTGGGASVSAVWTYDNTTTAADPGAGQFRLNNTTIASATALYISDETENGVDFSTILGVLNIGDEIYLQNGEDATEGALVTVTSITDNGTWYNYGITVNDTGTAATWTDGKEFGFLFLINSGGGGGAPTNAEYLVLTADATLTDERVFIDGAGLTATDGGAGGNYTLDVGAGSGIIVNADDIEVDTAFLDSLYVTIGAPAQTITSVKTFNPFGTGIIGQNDIVIGDITDYGLAAIGQAVFGRTNFNSAALDLDGSVLSFNSALPLTSNIEFAWVDGVPDIRFALAVPGVGNATYNPRSMLIAGPSVLDDNVVTVGFWQGLGFFDNLQCDTVGQGADLGVQNDLEVEGQIWVDLIQESTPAAGVTLQANPGTVDGQMVWDGNQIALFPSDISFGESYLIGWGPTGDPTTPFANRINLNSASGFNFLMSNANFPQFIIGSTDPTSAVFIDGNGNKDIRFNTLDTGFDQDNVVYFGYGGINLQDDAGDAIFIRSPQVVAGTYTITLPDTDGDTGQLLVNTDGAATLDWIDPPATPLPGAFTESGSTDITQTAATIGLDTEELDPDGNYALAAGEITVTEAGYYDIDYSIPVQQDTATGATRGSIRGFLERDQAAATFIEIPQSISRDYFREASGGAGVSGGCVVLLAAGEVIRVRAVISSTSDISSFPGEANLSIHRVRAA